MPTASRFQSDPQVPGRFIDRVTGQVFDNIDVRSDTLHDTVLYVAGAQTAGNKKNVFRDLANKDLLHTSLVTGNKIPENHVMKLNRIGVYPQQASGNVIATDSDVIKLMHAATMTFLFGSTLITRGPLFKYPSGFGFTGQTNRNNTGVVTLGPATQLGVERLEQEQIATDKTSLSCVLEMASPDWITSALISGATNYAQPSLAQDVAVQVHMGGIIERPQGG